jgi:glucose-inhibited division protein A
MGKMADRTYLQRRVLNRSKGPAVWALRAQTDKREYSVIMRRILEDTPNLFLREGMATELVLGPNEEVAGVRTFFGVTFRCKAAVLTTGTFMVLFVVRVFAGSACSRADASRAAALPERAHLGGAAEHGGGARGRGA